MDLGRGVATLPLIPIGMVPSPPYFSPTILKSKELEGSGERRG
jgi:hypothetical protein